MVVSHRLSHSCHPHGTPPDSSVFLWVTRGALLRAEPCPESTQELFIPACLTIHPKRQIPSQTQLGHSPNFHSRHQVCKFSSSLWPCLAAGALSHVCKESQSNSFFPLLTSARCRQLLTGTTSPSSQSEKEHPLCCFTKPNPRGRIALRVRKDGVKQKHF